MLHYTLTEAKAHFSEIVAAANGGEEIVLTKMGKETARLVPPKTKKKKSLLGCMQGKGPYYMADDFNEWTDELDEMFYGPKNK